MVKSQKRQDLTGYTVIRRAGHGIEKKIRKMLDEFWTVVTAHGRCIWLEGGGSLYTYNPATDQLKLKKKEYQCKITGNNI